MKSKKGLKKLLLLVSILGSLIVFTGCSSTKPQGSTIGYALSSAVGAGLGYAMDSEDPVYAVGGALAGVAAYEMYSQMNNASDQELYEAYEQGKREVRVETAKEFWRNETDGDGYWFELYDEKYDLKGKEKSSNRYRKIEEPYTDQGVNYGAYYQPSIEKN